MLPTSRAPAKDPGTSRQERAVYHFVCKSIPQFDCVCSLCYVDTAQFGQEALYSYLCVWCPVLGLGLYNDAPDTCSVADDCGAYVNDRERELSCLCCVVVGGLRKGWRNCSFLGWA